MRLVLQSFIEQVPEDLEHALGLLADVMWTSMQRDRDVLRVTLRDLDNFPELLERVWSELRANGYGALAAWLTSRAERGTVRVDDPEATAAVLLASLTYPPILNAPIGHTPGDVDTARYRSAWIHHALVTLTGQDTAQPSVR